MADLYFGRAFIRVNGESIASLPGTAKINPGGVERSPVVGDFGFLGWTEKPVHSEIEFDIAVSGSTDIGAINAIQNGTVVFKCDSGQQYIQRGASLATPIGPQAGDGKASLKFIGAPAEQA